jgi:hypothetical protein
LAAASIEYLYSRDLFRDRFNILAIRIGNAGSDYVRNLYDQLYFATLQYQARAQAALVQAEQALSAGDGSCAKYFVDFATTNVRQMRITDTAAVQAYTNDVEGAVRTYETLEAAGRVAAIAVAGPLAAAPATVAMLTGLDLAGTLAAGTLEGGWTQGAKDAGAWALGQAFVNLVPIPELGGMTIEQAVESGQLRALSDPVLKAALQRGLTNPQTRAAVLNFVNAAIGEAIQDLAAARVEQLSSALLGEFLAN